MRYRELGKTGLSVSEIGLGGEWLERHDTKEVKAVIDRCEELGINILDCWMSQPQVRSNIGAAIAGSRERWIIQGHIGSTWQNGQYVRTRDLEQVKIAFQDLLVSISFLAITAIVNSLGVIPSAGVGVAEKLCGFIMLVPSAFNQSMSAFVAQNMGAGKAERAKKALFTGVGLSLAVGVFMAWLAFFHGDLLAGLFARDAAVIAAAAEYLKAYAIDCLLVSIMFCMIGYFNGCQKTLFVMIQGIMGAFCVRIPVSLFMSRLKPVSLFKVGLATPCSSIVQIALCLGYFILLSRKKLPPEPEK